MIHFPHYMCVAYLPLRSPRYPMQTQARLPRPLSLPLAPSATNSLDVAILIFPPCLLHPSLPAGDLDFPVSALYSFPPCTSLPAEATKQTNFTGQKTTRESWGGGTPIGRIL